MHIANEKHGDMVCEIEFTKVEGLYIGTLVKRKFEVGIISGSSLGAVRAQFQVICEMVDAGGMFVTESRADS